MKIGIGRLGEKAEGEERGERREVLWKDEG